MLENVQAKAKHAAATTGIGLIATIALCVGLVFWTLAAWLFLLTLTTALTSAIILAALYTGAGLIGFTAVSARRNKAPPAQKSPTADNLVSAFMTGVQAGARTRR